MLRHLLLASLMLLSGHAVAAERLQIVATFSLLADIGREIAGEHAEVYSLMGADADPHLFQPPPSALKRLRRADLLISNGLNFEPWLPGLLASLSYSGAHCVASQAVSTLTAAVDHDHDHDHQHDHDNHQAQAPEQSDEHHHDALPSPQNRVDPHAWLSPSRARQYVDNIAAALSAADPVHASEYRARATRYVAQLDALDAQFRQQLAGVASEQRKLMVDHNAFAYLGDDYGLEFIAARASGEPSARDLARLIRLARQSGVRALLAENITDQRLLAQIAREANLPIVGTLYSDALASEGPASTYLGLMRHNLQLLGSVLSR